MKTVQVTIFFTLINNNYLPGFFLFRSFKSDKFSDNYQIVCSFLRNDVEVTAKPLKNDRFSDPQNERFLQFCSFTYNTFCPKISKTSLRLVKLCPKSLRNENNTKKHPLHAIYTTVQIFRILCSNYGLKTSSLYRIHGTFMPHTCAAIQFLCMCECEIHTVNISHEFFDPHKILECNLA